MTAPTGIRNYSNTATQATLTGAIGATDTTIALSTASGDPTAPFTAALARGTANEEIVLVTSLVGSTATVTRGYDGTTAKAQSAGATFQEVVVALDFREANNHVNSAGATHGVSSQLVGVSDTQTLTNKTLSAPAISNPTITGTATAGPINATAVSATTVTAGGAVTAAGAVTANGGLVVPAGQTAALAAAQVTATPSGASDVVRKDYVDNQLGAVGASAATPNAVVRRDANGRAQMVAPAAAGDVATKGYVDGKSTDTGWVTITALSNSNLTIGGSGARYRTLNGTTTVQIDCSYSGGISPFTVMTNLPAGSRPKQPYYFPVLSYGGSLGLCFVNTNGDVASGQSSWTPSGGFSLDITFITA